MVEHIQIKGIPPKIQYLSDGETLAYEFPFAIFEADNLEVYLGEELQPSTAYTVSGSGSTDGGSVTFQTAPEKDTVITLVRALEIRRTTDFQEGGALRASALNYELDYQTACQQQIADHLNRALVLPPYALNTDITLTLPFPAAGKAIVWNTAGTNLENSTIEVNALESTLKSYMETAKKAAEDADASAKEAAEHTDEAVAQAEEAIQKASAASVNAANASSEAAAASALATSASASVEAALQQLDEALKDIPSGSNVPALGTNGLYAKTQIDGPQWSREYFADPEKTQRLFCAQGGFVESNADAVVLNVPFSNTSYTVQIGIRNWSGTQTAWHSQYSFNEPTTTGFEFGMPSAMERTWIAFGV